MATPTTTRRPPATPKFRLTKQTERILELLAEYFCLRTNDVAGLIRGHEPNESDKRTVRFTLNLLHKAGLAYRLKYIEQHRDIGNPTFVWGLTDRGVQMMTGLFYHAKTFDEHSERTLDHELEISLFHIEMKKFCDKYGFVLYWQQSDLKRTVHPDALFAVTDPAKPAGKNTLYFFLEIERAKIGAYRDGEPSIMRKLGKMHEYYGSDLCQKEWGSFRQYRVIVVQRSTMRNQNLLKQLHEELNHRMFWLTTERDYKAGIGDYIFRTPKDFNEKAYGFLDA